MPVTYPQADVRDDVWGTDDHLWGPDVAALGLDDLVEDIELGERESWWATACLFASTYTREEDCCRSMTSVMVGEVASATSHRGLPFPAEWWPPSAGPMREAT
jgi:hypothetical protein